LPGYDALVAARSGRMLGAPAWRRKGPVFEALPRSTYAAAHLATQGILAALLARDETKRGQWVQTSLLQGNIAHTMGGWLVPAARAEETLRAWAAQPEPAGTPHDTMPAGYLIARCKDGRWIQVTSTTLHIFRNYLKLLGLDAIYEDPRF